MIIHNTSKEHAAICIKLELISESVAGWEKTPPSDKHLVLLFFSQYAVNHILFNFFIGRCDAVLFKKFAESLAKLYGYDRFELEEMLDRVRYAAIETQKAIAGLDLSKLQVLVTPFDKIDVFERLLTCRIREGHYAKLHNLPAARAVSYQKLLVKNIYDTILAPDDEVEKEYRETIANMEVELASQVKMFSPFQTRTAIMGIVTVRENTRQIFSWKNYDHLQQEVNNVWRKI